MNVTASTQQHVEVPQIEHDFFNDWLSIFILMVVYKNDGYKQKKYYGRIAVLCSTSDTLEW